MKKTLALVLAFMLCMALLASCDGIGGGTLSGKYSIVAMEENGKDVLSEYKDVFGVDDAALAEMFTLEFLSGGKCKVAFWGEDEEGTFTVSGNTVTITIDGDAQTATINGNKITLAFTDDYGENVKMVFEKK